VVSPDGSYHSVLINPKIRGAARQQLLDAARRGEQLDPDQARYVRVVEYTVPDREGEGNNELIALITTITDPTLAPAPALAQAYHQRWEHETGNKQLKTYLRGPGRVLRCKSPDMVGQEIYGYLLTHCAISALICAAATEADIDPDRIKFLRTVRIIGRQVTDPAAFSPGPAKTITGQSQGRHHPSAQTSRPTPPPQLSGIVTITGHPTRRVRSFVIIVDTGPLGTSAQLRRWSVFRRGRCWVSM
jgi:Transposase DDE domain